LRDHYDDIRSLGADVVAIGLGRPDMAAYFRDEFDIPFRLFVDPEKRSYKLLKLRRSGLSGVVGPAVWMRGAQSLLKGRGIAKPRQDPLQLGGVVVIDTVGQVSFVHRADDSSDNVPIEKLLDALGRV
jgi:peroxiredoxin